ncbi:MAG: pyridoxamine 5'-phosphate oxidase family protein [Armatimonadetes bacterium]|nr:pyridoxamine 5'-phosphate oxidase family protein [Armatimonadota bacterium]
MILPESARAVIARAPLAHVITLNRDGTPQVTVVWVDLQGDEFLVAHLGQGQKLKNLRRDPRVAPFDADRRKERHGFPPRRFTRWPSTGSRPATRTTRGWRWS